MKMRAEWLSFNSAEILVLFSVCHPRMVYLRENGVREGETRGLLQK